MRCPRAPARSAVARWGGGVEVERSNRFGPLTEERLARFEARIGQVLPADYRAFLLRHNGGRPVPATFVISAEEGTDTLHHTYGLHDGPSYFNLEHAYETHQGRVPAGLLAIADDPGGNAICLGIGGEHRGGVYFWDHEREAEEEAPPSFDNVTPVAPSFAAFLAALHRSEEE